MKRFGPRAVISVVTALGLFVSLTGCGAVLQAIQQLKGTSPESVATGSTSDSRPDEFPSRPDADGGDAEGPEHLPAASDRDLAQPSYHSFCDQLQQNGKLAGIAFLGYVNDPLRQEEYLKLLRWRGYLEEYSFLADIPEERLVRVAGGHQLYCVVPAGPDITVTINEWFLSDYSTYDGVEGTIGREIARSDGKPLLLISGPDRTVPSLQVSVENSKEKILIRTYPALSPTSDNLRDSSEDGFLQEFTLPAPHPGEIAPREPATPEVLQGDWVMWSAYDIDGRPLVCYLSFSQDEAGNNRVEYVCGPPVGDAYARMQGDFIPSAAPAGWITEDMSILSMDLVGGTAMKTGLPMENDYDDPYHFNGIFNIYYYPQLDMIEIQHQFGRPLIDISYGHSFIFERKIDGPNGVQ